MNVLLLRNILLLIACFVSPTLSAAIIEGSFRGTLQTISHAPYLPTEGYWENAAIGSEVSGSFRYDTDYLTNNFSPADGWYFFNNEDWLGSRVFIGGKNYVVSEFVPEDGEGSYYDEIWIHKLEAASPSTAFWLLDHLSLDSRGAPLKSMELSFSFVSDTFPQFNGWDLIESFDWYSNADPTAQVDASFSIYDRDQKEETMTWAGINIEEFHLRTQKSTSVSESSSFALLIICIIGFAKRFGVLMK